MLNLTPIKGSNQYAASNYFSGADDYYIDDGDSSEWQGRGAEYLELAGRVDQTMFSRMLAGFLPNGTRIAYPSKLQELPDGSIVADRGGKRMGWDITFSAPKSVSMQALIAGNRDIVKAHDEAVTAVMAHVEQLALTRRKVNGKSARERTGNMVIGKFRHALSRDKDPQLHTHALVLNMTRRADGEWRALVADDLFGVQHELGARYKLELASRLQALGYEIRLTDGKGNFELAHISREQIEAFSARSATIESVLSDRGKTRATASTKEKQQIAIKTRPRKEKTDIDKVRRDWLDRSALAGVDYQARASSLATPFVEGAQAEHNMIAPDGSAGVLKVHSRPPKLDVLNVPGTAGAVNDGGGGGNGGVSVPVGQVIIPEDVSVARAVVRYAINHLTEREACVRESELVRVALERAVGLKVTSKDVEKEIARLEATGSLIPGAYMYTAAGDNDIDRKSLSPVGWAEMLCETRDWTIERARRYVSRAINKGTLIPDQRSFTTPKALKQEKAIFAIEREGRRTVSPLMKPEEVDRAFSDTTLNEGQQAAIRAIVGTSNRFVGIQGDAGTGKTFAVKHAVDFINNMTSEQYKVLALAPYGNQIKVLKQEGMEARTLASFLYSRDKKIDDKTIIVLDEASVVGARQLLELMRTVEKAGARLVMLGDTKQTEAIEAGKPFAQLQHAGMESARISQILRQKTPRLKQAVEAVAHGNAVLSVQKISVVEVQDEYPEYGGRNTAMVADYMRMTPEVRDSTLLIAGTNQDRRMINELVRNELGLEGRGMEYGTLARVDTTQAERRVAATYRAGMIIQPERDYEKAGLVRWQNYKVIGHLPGNLLEIATEKSDEVLTINPRKITKISVYELEKTEMAVGDLVRVTRNDIGKDLTNGDKMRVVGIEPGLITVRRLDSPDAKPLDLDARSPLHLMHAYSATVHSAQGSTCDNVLISLGVKNRTTSQNLYYVAISRARETACIYTDNSDKLPESISRIFTKTTASSIRDGFLDRWSNNKQPIEVPAMPMPVRERSKAETDNSPALKGAETEPIDSISPEDFENYATFAASQERRGSRESGRQRDKEAGSLSQAQPKPPSRIYLAVPSEEYAEAKKAGVSWDGKLKLCYISDTVDVQRFSRWLPENQTFGMSPSEEFAEFLRGMGLEIEGKHPIMDGRFHNVRVEGGKPGAMNGSYIWSLNGLTGHGQNFKTGEKQGWKAKGYYQNAVRDDAQKAQIAMKEAELKAERAAQQSLVANEATKQLKGLAPILRATPYLASKGIDPSAIAALAAPGKHGGLYTDARGQRTYIPLHDENGKVWMIQTIQPNGTKRFPKAGRKEGNFHAIGGMDALDKAPVIIITEGYSTGGAVAAAEKLPVAAAIDSGNLPIVARILREKYPDKPIVIAGDDDRHLVFSQGKNTGREKAEAAAKEVGGVAVFPVFDPQVTAWPSDVPKITPAAYKAHLKASKALDKDSDQLSPDDIERLSKDLLSTEQFAVFNKMRAYTDFNDLAQKTESGFAAVKRLVDRGIEQAVQARNKEHQGLRPNLMDVPTLGRRQPSTEHRHDLSLG